MEFRLADQNDKVAFYDTLFEMMVKSDNDFIPPLSKRSSTTQMNLKENSTSGGNGSIRSYLDEMMEQKILLCIEDGELLGFVSFKENYTCDVIGNENLPNIYLSTLILDEKARGKGLTKKMYAHLFEEIYPDRSIFTRTWSTNVAHIKILGGFDFEIIKRIDNDRGEGIDTVYFAKKR